MAVYTQLLKNEIEDLLAGYDCGALVEFEGIMQGVENTNYVIKTTTNKFILTIFEKRTNENDLPFFFGFMEHLHKHGIECPFVIQDREGQGIQKIAGKSAALFSFLDGNNIGPSSITPQKCFEMGVLLARMHIAASDFKQSRTNSMSLPAWKVLFEKIKTSSTVLCGGDDLGDLMESELTLAEKTLGLDLPKTIVHADAFPDNIFEREGKICGVIDFYFSATDFLIYDLALTVNSWCFENGELNRDRFAKMLEGYESLRPLNAKERMAYQDVSRMAALRILMTRSYDWLFHDPKNLVKPKDPLEYKRVLEFHRDQNLFS